MAACSKFKELLMLDPHSALDPGDQIALNSHLKSCSKCRQEREGLQGLLDKVRTSCEPPVLSEAEAEAMVDHVRERLADAKARPSMISRVASFRFVPVAAACIFMVVGILGYRAWIGGPRTDIQQEEQINQRDLEIIRNLDLLRNLDAIRRVVDYVDEADRGAPDNHNGAERHGRKNRGSRYA